VSVIAALVCAILANGAYTYLQQEYGFGKEAFLGCAPGWSRASCYLGSAC